MNNLSSRRVTFCLLALPLAAGGALAGASCQAQGSSELAATYGRGVHAFFAGQSGAAEELFSEVINAGSKDPRVYYFRAIARMGCGREYEAELDMKVGAAFEARDPGNRYVVSKALERVQGPNRRTLEAIRQQARLDRVQERQQLTRDRYENLEQREPDVLRREMPVPLEDLVEPSLRVPGVSPSTQPTPAPAAQPAVPPSDPGPTQPLPPAEPAEEDPFEAEPATEPTAPAESPPPAEATPPSEDPFGEPAAADDPEEESEQPAPPPAPADDAADEDPFAAAAPGAAAATTTAAAVGQLEESDRVESEQLVGIIGRVAASVVPWQGFELPHIGPVGGAEGFSSEAEPAAIALGPVEEDSAVSPAGAEEPIESETGDIFSESETPAPAKGLSGEAGPRAPKTPPATEAPEAEESPASSGDPFEF